MKKILLIVLLLSFGFSQQEWNMEFMRKYIVDGGTLIIPPNSRKPYTGKVFSLYNDGTKKEEGKYRNGLKDGKWTSWHENGQKRKEGTYKDGKMIKKKVWNNAHLEHPTDVDNVNVYEKTYKDGKLDRYTEWYGNGQKKKEGTYKGVGKYGDPQEDGKWTYWYDNGQKEEEVTFKDGKRDGLRTNWYDNGQKRAEGNYKDGETISEKHWNEDGSV